MSKLENNIKNRFQDFEVQPPEEVWHAIEAQLDKRSSRKFVWLKAAAAIAILIATSFGVVYFISSDSSQLIVSQLEKEEKSVLVDTTEVSVANPIDENIPNIDSNPLAQKTFEKEVLTKNLAYDNSSFATMKSTPRIYHTNHSEGIVRLQPIEKGIAQNFNYELASFKEPSFSQHENEVLASSSNNIKTAIALSANNDRSSAFSLSAYLSPQQSYRYQTKTSYIPFESVESEIMSFALGANITYRINSRIAIQGGVGYNRIGQRIHDVAVYSHPSRSALYTFQGKPTSRHPQSMNTSMGGIIFTDQSFYFADISASRVLTLKGTYDESNVKLLNKTGQGLIQQMNYLEIPLVLQYKLMDKNISVSAKAGVAANMLKSDKVYLDGASHKSPVGSIVDIVKFNWAGLAGLVFSYPVSRQINLALEPTVSMFVDPISVNANLSGQTHPYNFSLYMGISYDL